MEPRTYHQRISVLLAVTVFCFVLVDLLPPIPQDLDYHDFADKRPLWGIPNFGDVTGNIAFLISGMTGLAYTWGCRHHLQGIFLWTTFFLGVFLTGIGSGYYHLSPDNQTLVWDRLPMTIAFMSLFSLILMERIDRRAGKIAFPFLLAAGTASVWYWHWTETMGNGDLRPYALVQFFPLISILLILRLFPAAHKGTRYLIYTLGWYIAAKVFEHFDPEIFQMTGEIISGHTIKHICAALGTACMIPYMLSTVKEGKNA